MNDAYIFLMFLSSMFYPLTDLPGWFQWTARINPMAISTPQVSDTAAASARCR
jgi:ABC-type polysaccharide/polyol phosphate export permease